MAHDLKWEAPVGEPPSTRLTAQDVAVFTSREGDNEHVFARLDFSSPWGAPIPDPSGRRLVLRVAPGGERLDLWDFRVCLVLPNTRILLPLAALWAARPVEGQVGVVDLTSPLPEEQQSARLLVRNTPDTCRTSAVEIEAGGGWKGARIIGWFLLGAV